MLAKVLANQSASLTKARFQHKNTPALHQGWQWAFNANVNWLHLNFSEFSINILTIFGMDFSQFSPKIWRF